jgi:hypothetical protein
MLVETAYKELVAIRRHVIDARRIRSLTSKITEVVWFDAGVARVLVGQVEYRPASR